jgi:quinoprotein glucose dehydrogenase
MWRYDPGVSTDNIPYSASCRGVAYHAQPALPEQQACRERVIEATLDARLIAVDASTGVPCAGFGNNGHVDLLVGMGEPAPGFVAATSPPTIVRGVAVVGHQVLDGQREDAPSGVIRGYDAVTGELVWAWDLGRPDETGPGDTGPYTPGTPNAWTTFSGDEELGLVYVPMGNSSVDYYGGNRSKEEGRYSTALVALRADTGEVQWVFQTVHHDVWDYDLGSQGTLVEFPMGRGGATARAVILPTKAGDIFVLNRRTGEPLTAVEERPVPPSPLPDESLSPTQPFSVQMPTLARPDIRERDTWGISPLDQLWCRIQFRRANYDGRYTPPSVDKPWIQYPGYNGGNDWGGVSLDEQRGILVANYTDFPMYNQLVPREEADEQGLVPLGDPGGSTKSAGTVPQAGAPYAAAIRPWRTALGMPCKRPPYGGIMAVDLESRKVLWDVPLGTARRNGPFGIPSMLPFVIGTPNNGGPAITAGGLIFIAAATDNLIRAMDIETGEVLWEDTLPAGGQATPMTYEAHGKQFVVIVAGGHHFMETPIGDYLIAYALPD